MDDQRRPATRTPYTGPGHSRSLQQAQEITSPTQRPDRAGRTLITRNHEVIRRWAEERGARPATMPGSEYNGRLGVLRFDFPGYGGAVLRQVGWDEWFETFDDRRLRFLYQEQRADGSPSNFNRLERPRREER
ncbi:hypothetical protein [Nocardia bhagyanarayanae]|uniref:1,4-alpha-glucan branching enzyme n=1 Tax=Nocardia bhagyanarayanae TaxID=1215925 RepID=A0A543FGN5_9NOCA|nr:hypothetical protein [Nocardia bhagyanarayanae]TQM33020.1 hypothetical protein FB390_4733 [Nocardia bhagyanarayanae]